MKSVFVKILCITSAAYLFGSCTDKDVIENDFESPITLTPQEYISIAYDVPKEISEEQALEIAKDFGKECKTRTTSIKPSITNKTYWSTNIQSAIKMLPASKICIPVYEIALNNGEKGGFAIISADERNPCVIAYSSKGFLCDSTENASVKMMLQTAKNALYKDYLWFEDVKNTYRDKTLSKLKRVLKVENVNFDKIKDKVSINNVLTRSVAVTYPSTGDLVEEGGTIIPVTWGQDEPFYDLMEATTGESPDYPKNLIGCVGVATAEIVAYYEALSSAYGCSLNWNQLKAGRITNGSDENVKKQVASLCKYVAYGIQTEWDGDGYATSNMKKSYTFLNSLGIVFDAGRNYNGYDLDVVSIVSSLRENHPVLVSGYSTKTRSTGTGGGHCWILDAYQLRTRPTASRIMIKANDTYIHANFGWEGFYDGYYLVDRETSDLEFDLRSMGVYNQNIRIYPHVRRK